MKKNVGSQVIGAQMVTAADGSAFTGAVTVYVTGDGGTQAAGSVGSGACTHEGNGFHTYVPAQAETNYDHVAFTFTGTGAVPATVQVYPSFPQTGDSFARLGAPAGASVSADVAAVKVDTAATLADTNELQTDWVNGGRLDLIVDAILTDTADMQPKLGTPAGVSMSADIAAVKSDTAAILVDTGTTLDAAISAIKTKTDYLPSATAGAAGGVFIAGANAATSITTALTANITGNITGNLSGSVGSVTGAVGSVTGAVGSVTGNVGGNVVGSVGSVTGAVGSVTGAVGSVTGAVGSVTGNVGGNVVGSIGSLAAQAKADVNAEVDTALDTAIPGTPTAGSVNDVLKDLDARLPPSGTLSTLTAANVNTEVVDALATDTYAEPGQGAPPATTTIAVKLGYVYKAMRNKSTQTATEFKLFADDASTVDQKAAVSDDGTTFTRGELATGP